MRGGGGDFFDAELSPERYWRGLRSQNVGKDHPFLYNASLFSLNG